VKLQDACVAWLRHCGINDCPTPGSCAGKSCRLSELVNPQGEPRRRRAVADELAHDLAGGIEELFMLACPGERCAQRLQVARLALDHFLAIETLGIEHLQTQMSAPNAAPAQRFLNYQGRLSKEQTSLTFTVNAGPRGTSC